jgi:AbrB family looped-hinge helix DNA binding protein
MDVVARISSRGRVTLPKHVRDTLGLKQGDSVLFRVRDGQARLTRIPDLLELAGSIPVPPDVRGLSWEEIRERAHRARGELYRSRVEESRP